MYQMKKNKHLLCRNGIVLLAGTFGGILTSSCGDNQHPLQIGIIWFYLGVKADFSAWMSASIMKALSRAESERLSKGEWLEEPGSLIVGLMLRGIPKINKQVPERKGEELECLADPSQAQS